jgi:hypothetical protein
MMNSTERAMELGFSAQEARDVTSVFRGRDDRGKFELYQLYLEDVDVNGTHVMFEEANDLADAVAGFLSQRDPGEEGTELGRMRRTLAAYDRRWEISRG